MDKEKKRVSRLPGPQANDLRKSDLMLTIDLL